MSIRTSAAPARKPGARRDPRRPGRRRRPLVPALLGLLVLLGVVAVIASRGGDDGTTVAAGVEQTRPVTVTGEALPAHQPGVADPAVGRPAPELTGQSFSGEPITIAHDGRPKVVMFVAHWCPHCQREVPQVARWLDAGHKPEGVDLITVSTSVTPANPNYPPSTWLEREGWTPPVLVDSEDRAAADAYGLTGFPYFVAIDKDGDVAARASGELTDDQVAALFRQAQV